MKAYNRGHALDVTSLVVLMDADGNTDRGVDALESSIYVKRDDVIALLLRDGVTVPAFLMPCTPDQEGRQQGISQAPGPINTLKHADSSALANTQHWVSEDDIVNAFPCLASRRDLFRDGHVFEWCARG